MEVRLRKIAAVFLAFSSLSAAAPSYYKDVLPVLQNKCQSCHRPGEAAPMSLLTYESTRPWAAAIKQAVLSKKMPPWGADPAHGKFANDPTLTEAEKETLVSWADARAPAGRVEDAPAPRAFVEGWNIGAPDMVVEMPRPYLIAASGTIPYMRYILPLNFTEDRWVSAAEIRPGNRNVVHHVIAYLRPQGSTWYADAPAGLPIAKVAKAGTPGAALAGYAPGVPATRAVAGRASLVKAGTDLVLEVHYTANGKPATDQTKVGIVFAKEPPQESMSGFVAANSSFVIPPGAANHEVKTTYTISEPARLVNLTPHMHLRGKDFEYTARYPTGETEILLKVPRYDFNWQHTYTLAEPKLLPAGTVIECIAHFDNSANNPFNPDPKSEIRWGDQSWEEMMVGFGGFVVDAAAPTGQADR